MVKYINTLIYIYIDTMYREILQLWSTRHDITYTNEWMWGLINCDRRQTLLVSTYLRDISHLPLENFKMTVSWPPKASMKHTRLSQGQFLLVAHFKASISPCKTALEHTCLSKDIYFLSCAYRKTSRCPSRVAAENVVLSNLQHLRTSGYPPLAEWLEIFLSIGKALFFSCIHPFEFGEQPLPCRCSWVIQWCFPKQDWSNSELHFGMLLLRTFWIRASIHRAHLRVKILGAVINYTID